MERIAIAGVVRLSLYLKHIGAESIFADYSAVLKSDATIDNLKEVEASFTGDDIGTIRCSKIIELCGNNELALCALELAVLRYVDERVGYIFEYLAPGTKTGVTLELAGRVMELAGGIGANTSMILDAYERLRIILLGREETSDYARANLCCDFRLASFLGGHDFLDADLYKHAIVSLPTEENQIYGFDTEIKELKAKVTGYYDYIKDHEEDISEPLTIIISGENGSGRRTFSKAVASAIEVPLVTMDYEYFVRCDDPMTIMIKLFRECLLLDAALAVSSIRLTSDTKDLIDELRRHYDIFGCRPLILLCDTKVKPLPYLKGSSIAYEIPKLTVGKRLHIFEGFIEQLNIKSEIDVAEIVSKMNLTAGQMKKLCQMIKTDEKAGEVIETKDIYNLCYKVLDDGRYTNIKRVNAGYTLDDLKVSEKSKNILKDVCNQVSYRRKVFDDWGMSQKYAYGKCVSLLLAGPPGTGKTMAVHAISSQLGLELYKVDLSQIVDKYIGETEKRLEEVFDKAQKSNMILFFDEADAVLGKRSETHDSHDKYANTEIAFILQRMEEYDGIVILATNYIQNIDTAFMRRIRYVVNFDLPDAATRKAIWMGAIAPEVPLSKDVDFDFLANQFELAGGNIKNIVLNATFLAAADGSELDMEHIIRAISNDNSKDKRIAFTNDYGNYGYLVKD